MVLGGEEKRMIVTCGRHTQLCHSGGHRSLVERIPNSIGESVDDDAEGVGGFDSDIVGV